ncbi:MAG: formylglycine-generating enzyme family protein [Methylococcaceae bacterium]
MLSQSKGAVGRADLLTILDSQGKQALENMAFAFGYERTVIDHPDKEYEPSEKITPVQPAAKPIHRPSQLPGPRFFYAAQRIRKPQSEKPVDPAVPEWFENAKRLSEDALPDRTTLRLPAYQPLIRWPRLWPFLRTVLGRTLPSKHPDIPRLINDVSRGLSIRQIPLRKQHSWSTTLCIVLDFQDQTEPFFQDFNQLCAKLKKLHGKLGIDVRILYEQAGIRTQYMKPKGNQVLNWKMPNTDTPLLILSDLGLLSESPQQRLGWECFGRLLRAAGCQPMVLCPVPEWLHESTLSWLFRLYCWDRNSQLRVHNKAVTSAEKADSKFGSGVDKLLTLLSAAIVIEPPLLRAVRTLLPADQANVADEAMFWQHPDIISSTQGCCYKNLAAVSSYQHKLHNSDFWMGLKIESEPGQQNFKQRLVTLIRAHHVYLPESVRMMEMALCDRLFPGTVDSEMKLQIKTWQQAMAKTCYHQASNDRLQQWNREYIDSLPLALLKNPQLAALWAFAQKHTLNQGEIIHYPDTINKQDVDFIFASETSVANQPCQLFQTGHELRITDQDTTTLSMGSYYTDLILEGDLSIKTVSQQGKNAESQWQWQHSTDSYTQGNSMLLVEMGQAIEQVSLRNDSETILLKSLTKPPWASQIGRDTEGLWVEFEQHGKSWRVYWPEWGGELSYDEYGLYCDLTIKDISQRCRFIPAGTFLMGSPKSEKERRDNETQHEVTLTEGFWLADTGCTQALWQTVMGENPAHFKEDENNPVEQVSWDDVQHFLTQLNALLPGLNAQLPSEAQWEYACRAGTITPFSFGDNITPEQVNYHGDHPYAGGKKGLYREKTVPVKSLPANPWGLYEMHGNVWEWCQDWHHVYSKKAMINPTGPKKGMYRVLRGGSWISSGGRTRSAYRGRYVPDNRLNLIGFRFAPGQAKSRAAEPQIAASERGNETRKDPLSLLGKLKGKVKPKQ